MLEFLINLLKNYSLYLHFNPIGIPRFLRTYKNETGTAKHEQLKWHVSPHCFCEAFLKGYRFFSRRVARSSLVTAAGDSSEVIMWSLGWFETSKQLLGSEVRAVTHPTGVFLFSFCFLFFQGCCLTPGFYMHVIFKKKEISKTWHFRHAFGLLLTTVIHAISKIPSLEEGFFIDVLIDTATLLVLSSVFP